MHMGNGCLRLLRLRPDLVHKSPLHSETAFHAPRVHYGRARRYVKEVRSGACVVRPRNAMKSEIDAARKMTKM